MTRTMRLQMVKNKSRAKRRLASMPLQLNPGEYRRIMAAAHKQVFATDVRPAA